MNKIKISYFISTGLLSLIMCMSAGMYFFKNPEISSTFIKLGFPTYIIYPLAVAKLLGLIAIWTRKSTILLNMAYAGFFYNFVLAFFAHLMIRDGDFPGALVAMIMLIISYITQTKYFKAI